MWWYLVNLLRNDSHIHNNLNVIHPAVLLFTYICVYIFLEFKRVTYILILILVCCVD
jgi:hypothetical protein